MVKGHQEALEMIDGRLSKSADHERVKKHLKDTRETIAQHLAEGKKLQANMQH